LYKNHWSNAGIVVDATTGIVNDTDHLIASQAGFGYIAVYGYGFGSLSRTVPDGTSAAGLNPLANQNIAVTVDGIEMPLWYAGAAPGSVGQTEIVVKVPTTAATSQNPIRSGSVLVNGVEIGQFQYWGSPSIMVKQMSLLPR
jgi:uncharacterized protein (TIGR03437 family)